MRRFIPPIPTMRALEAAIRHESFSSAAAELGITQSAISHQIKDLEIKLGVALFRRLARRTVPTKEARALGLAIGSGVSLIQQAVDKIMDRSDGNAISISALPGFAVQWLFPRLIDFDERHPGVSVSLGTSDRLSDIAAGEADIAVRYGRGNYRGVVTEMLLDDHIFPVCSAAYLASHGPIDSPKALLSHTLLIDDTRAIDGFEPSWPTWFKLAGEHFSPQSDYRKFGQSNMVIQAALAGLGVALGRSALVVDALSAGELVIPIRLAFPSGFSHYLVTAKQRSEVENVADFKRWIIEQADVSNARIKQLLSVT
ncbi:MAG: LysR substrate-binding domain-containing protein [Proteobacteria bacterium]|nr:LysR substrate-binding domain-containing protein [Pseudomonadota bacterium]